VGSSGNGIVMQSGGSVAAAGTLTLAASASGTGRYNFSGGSLTATSLLVNAGGTLTQTGGSITLQSLSQTGGSILLGGLQPTYALSSLQISGGITALTTDAPKTLSTQSISLGGGLGAWTGQLEIANNALIVTPTANKSAVLSILRDQVAYGATNHAGITSSTTAADPTHKTTFVIDNALLGLTQFNGVPVTSSSILVESTYFGDSNLDRKVDVTDLGTLATNYGKTTTLGPLAADFNNDGKIDVTDLGLLATNYGLGTSGSPFSLNSVLGLQSLSFAPAPEPATLLLLTLSSSLLLRSRRHQLRR
jgi:hypothetical protein